MHNLEINERGHIRGWVAGSESGVPGYIEIIADNVRFRIAATIERPDVLMAGHSLFSGFDLTINAGAEATPLTLQIGKRSYSIDASFRGDSDYVRVDSLQGIEMEGWIDHEVPLYALQFSDGINREFPQLLPRQDIAALKDARGTSTFGFQLSAQSLGGLRFCLVNNSHLHVFRQTLQPSAIAA